MLKPKEQHRCSRPPALRGEVGSEEGLEMPRKGGECAEYSPQVERAGKAVLQARVLESWTHMNSL